MVFFLLPSRSVWKPPLRHRTSLLAGRAATLQERASSSYSPSPFAVLLGSLCPMRMGLLIKGLPLTLFGTSRLRIPNGFCI